MNSITETLKKINIDISRSGFYSILFSILIINLFIIYKMIQSNNYNNNLEINLISHYNNNIDNNNQDFFQNKFDFNENYIYASKSGKKYYFYDCKSKIKEENKIYFETEEEAKNSGRTLSDICK